MSRAHIIRQAVRQAGRFRLAEPLGPSLGKTGFQRGNRAGSSLEYKDFREYRPGDDLRFLDWNAYGRTDRLIIKCFHEEVTPHLDLLVDLSRSMDLPDSHKGDAAVFLTAFYAAVAAQTGYSCNIWLLGERCLPLDGASHDPLSWQPLIFDATCSPVPALMAQLGRLKPGAMRLLLSDTMWLDDPKHVVGGLSDGAASVAVIRPLAERELQIPKGGHVRLVDSETGASREILLSEAALDRYRRSLERHQRSWQEAATQSGVHLIDLETERFMAAPFDDPGPWSQLLRPNHGP